jgi:dynein heavy chain
VLAVEGYAKGFKDIEPKRIKCNNLQEKLKKSEDELNQLRENFEKLKNMNANLDKAKTDMDNYQKQTQQLQAKLERAEKLINGLASTKEGWQERKKKLEEKYINLVGDALMTAAFLSYAGPFPSEYREVFVK